MVKRNVYDAVIALRLPGTTLAAVDIARGDTTRPDWLRAAINAALPRTKEPTP